MNICQYLIIIGLVLASTLNPLLANDSRWNTGGVIGISASLGTKVNRIGFLAGGYLAFENVQFNTYLNRLYCFNSYGPDLRKIENQVNFGVTGSFGPPDVSSEFIFFSPVSNFTGKRHSVSYVYKIYSDNISTSQNTGLIGFEIGKFQFLTENDLYIFKGSDKYRTGAFSFLYEHQNLQFGVKCLLWTGNNNDEKRLKIPPGADGYTSEFGYYDLSKTKYGTHSHGILAFYGAYQLPNSQVISANAGIDSEQIRHVIQNKILHDMPFVPRKWNKAINPHFPKLDMEGKPFINKEGQKTKKPELFGTISLNPTLFY